MEICYKPQNGVKSLICNGAFRRYNPVFSVTDHGVAIILACAYLCGMATRPDNLTDLQARFAEEYLLDLNATQAAIRAGSTAERQDQAGYEFLRNPEVQEYIQVLRAERSKTTKIDAAWLLERLAAEASADVRDLYDEHGAVRPIDEWPLIFRQGLIQGIEVEEEYDEVDDPDEDFRDPDDLRKRKKIRKAVGRVVKFKLDSRVKRLELIGRHIGVQAFRDQVGLGGPNGGPIEITAVSARERIAGRLDKLAPPVPMVDGPEKSD